jgi:hypothetical protein
MITYLPNTNLNLKLRHCQERSIYDDVPIIGWAVNHYGVFPISLANMKPYFGGILNPSFAVHDTEASATHIQHSNGSYEYVLDDKNGGVS